jgi:hypothetical protein
MVKWVCESDNKAVVAAQNASLMYAVGFISMSGEGYFLSSLHVRKEPAERAARDLGGVVIYWGEVIECLATWAEAEVAA